MRSEGWKCYFRDSIFQNLLGEHAPEPPKQLKPSALVTSSPNKSNLAMALHYQVTKERKMKRNKNRSSYKFMVYSYAYMIPAIAYFLHFVATEESPRARSSFETKCNAFQRMESMTEDLEGIFVDGMRRNHFSLFLTKCEKRGRRARASKKIEAGEKENAGRWASISGIHNLISIYLVFWKPG